MTLHGKHALITGSSRGIGRGIAMKLAESGVKIAVHYYQDEDAAKKTLAEVSCVRSSKGLTTHDWSSVSFVAAMKKEFP